jgi:hypothetical protein
VKAPDYIAAFFGFALIDYGRAGDGLMISSGAGLMMAAMDVCPRVRWCVDLDAYRPIWTRVPELMVALDRNCALGVICVTGAFLNDKPHQLQAGLARVTRTPTVAYCSRQRNFVDEASTLEVFAQRVACAQRVAALPVDLDHELMRCTLKTETAAIRMERERLRISEQPAPRADSEAVAHVEGVDGHNGSESYHADHATARHVGELVELKACSDAVERLVVGVLCSDDEQRATIVRDPSAVLDPLDAVHDKRSPRLADAQKAHRFNAQQAHMSESQKNMVRHCSHNKEKE